MSYIKLTNGVPEPYSISKLKWGNQNVSFPADITDETLAEYGVYRVTDEPQPAFDPKTQVSTLSEPYEQGGQWVRTWSVRDKTQEELDAEINLWREGATLSRRQFCIAAYRAGLLSEADAIAAAKGEWPASFDFALEGLPTSVVTEAKIEWASVSEIRRTAPLLEIVRASQNVPAETLDTMFGLEP